MPKHTTDRADAQFSRDRAAATASTIFWVLADAVRGWFAGAPLDRSTIERHIADLLRDEFAALEQDLASERTPTEPLPD